MTIVRAAPGSAERRAMLALRTRVLRAPLGLSYSEAQLAGEQGQLHLALLRDGAVLGALLAVPPDAEGTARLRQMAIDPGFERRGFGSALVGRAEEILAGMGAAAVTLSARQNAVGFYEKLGYAARGAPFVEVTLPHRTMGKRL